MSYYKCFLHACSWTSDFWSVLIAESGSNTRPSYTVTLIFFLYFLVFSILPQKGSNVSLKLDINWDCKQLCELYDINPNVLYSYLSPLQLSQSPDLEVQTFQMSVKDWLVRSMKNILLQLATYYDTTLSLGLPLPVFSTCSTSEVKIEPLHFPFWRWQELSKQHSLSNCGLFNLASMKYRYDKHSTAIFGKIRGLNLSSVKTNKSVFHEILSENVWKYFVLLSFNPSLEAFGAIHIFQKQVQVHLSQKVKFNGYICPLSHLMNALSLIWDVGYHWQS